MKHTYYRTCPHCGCNLDPGEQCDCKKGSERIDGRSEAGTKRISQTVERTKPRKAA